jgi:hypothetical protein
MKVYAEDTGNQTPRPKLNARSLGRRERDFLVGALLALSLFLVEAGVAEILIGSDEACREGVRQLRLAPDPFAACNPEWVWFMLRAIARGWAWLFNPSAAPILGWVSMSGYYALAGGISAQLDRRNTILLLFVIQVGTVAIISGIGYLLQFIA